MTHLSKQDAHNGAMVALFPSPDAAAQLAQPGGEPAEDLHVTLAYLGPAANIDSPEYLRQAVAEWAAKTAPLKGNLSGTGTFTAGETPVTYASVDLPMLPAARERLIQCLSYMGLVQRPEHGLSPHITLTYDARQVLVPNVALTFDQVTLAIGDNRETFPLAGAHAEWIVPLWKADIEPADPEDHVVYGVVLQPGVSDSQGDDVTAREIEKAAWDFLVQSRKQDLQHNEQTAAVDVVESYIAPADLEVAGRTVLKGSWVMASRVTDPGIWAGIQKGEITGFSIGGTAIRT